MKCEAKTTKKAWANPLAPRSRCEREAKRTVKVDGHERQLCTEHALKAASDRSLSTVCRHCGSIFVVCCGKEK